jgi:hypothetical protein
MGSGQNCLPLGFPLLLPVAAGYHASAASAAGGRLSVSMSADTPGGAVLSWRGEFEVEALSLGYSPVSTSALVQAATDLRPATAAALAGLGP